jgi:hypothetical protein
MTEHNSRRAFWKGVFVGMLFVCFCYAYVAALAVAGPMGPADSKMNFATLGELALFVFIPGVPLAAIVGFLFARRERMLAQWDEESKKKTPNDPRRN